jgi:hypothetical protein
MPLSPDQVDEAFASFEETLGKTDGGKRERAGKANGLATPGLGVWNAGADVTSPPPRGWLLGNTFCRRFLSSVFGDGGVGKTAVRYAQALALATGRPLTGEHVFQRARVLIISLEDDADELRRRILAARLHFNITASDVDGWLFLSAPGRAGGKLLTTDKNGSAVIGKLSINLKVQLEAHGIDLVMLDPFIKSHSVSENANDLIDEVAQVLFELAEKYDIAVDAPHHISKGTPEPGNAHRGRGASALPDACRLVSTLTPMTPEEAKAFGISEEDRFSYVRLDRAKVNITRRGGAIKWFHLVGVPLGNATDLYPAGDEVQTVEPWEPPPTWAGLSNEVINQILNDIDVGIPGGNFYTDAAKASDREAWRVVQKHAPTKSEAQGREVIRAWVKTGLLVPFEYENPTTRKVVRGLKVDCTKRPG